jgi:hypothetical protein
MSHPTYVECEHGHTYRAWVTRGNGGPPETRFREPDEYEPDYCPICDAGAPPQEIIDAENECGTEVCHNCLLPLEPVEGYDTCDCVGDAA